MKYFDMFPKAGEMLVKHLVEILGSSEDLKGGLTANDNMRFSLN